MTLIQVLTGNTQILIVENMDGRETNLVSKMDRASLGRRP